MVYCYAGKDIATGEWVRPVSDDEGHAISAYYRVVAKGDPARVGDILGMALGNFVGHGYQTENYAHIKRHWQRLGRLNFEQAQMMTDTPPSI